MFRPTIFRNNLVDSIFDDFFQTPFWDESHQSTMGTMSTDVTESDKEYRIEMDLPGYAKEDVNASLKDGYLTVSAQRNKENEDTDKNGKVIRRERYQGMCRRSFYVGEHITETDINASFKDGVLTLQVPKKERQPEIEQKKFISIN